MFAGHFGVAAAVKAKVPEVPVWALLVSTQVLDIAFVPLMLADVESIAGEGYGQAVLDVTYSHSLVGALVLAILCGILAWRFWGCKAGAVVGGVVFSHWLLDLLVHRPDLPVLPGNWGGLPMMGLGLWNTPGWSIAVESMLLLTGAVLYYRSTLEATQGRARQKAHYRGILMVLFLAITILVDTL